MSNELTRVEQVKKYLLDSQDKISKVASGYIEAEQLVSLTLAAAVRQPDLFRCTQHSLLNCLVTAARLGLDPTGVGGQAYLIPRKNKEGQLEANFQIGYQGLCELYYREGAVRLFDVEIVYAGDRFQYELGDQPYIRHAPDPELARVGVDGEGPERAVACYMVAQLANGAVARHVMTRGQILRIRSASQSGPVWKQWPEAMWRKTVLRQGIKFLPKCSTKLVAAIAEADSHEFDFDEQPGRVRPESVEAALEVAENGRAPTHATSEAESSESVQEQEQEEPKQLPETSASGDLASQLDAILENATPIERGERVNGQ